MEKVIVHAHFHTGHRQLGFPGHCKYVHGHTWRGRITVATEEFPRDFLDMSLDFAALKKVMRDLDHRMVVTEDDKLFLDAKVFEPEGVVVIPGRGPSVENVCQYIFNGVAKVIREKYAEHKGMRFTVEMHLQETDNNFFVIEKDVVI